MQQMNCSYLICWKIHLDIFAHTIVIENGNESKKEQYHYSLINEHFAIIKWHLKQKIGSHYIVDDNVATTK